MVNQNNFTHARESKIYNFLKIKIVFLYGTVETPETASVNERIQTRMSRCFVVTEDLKLNEAIMR